MEIKFSPPDISDDEINEVIDTLKSGWITTGPKTKLLEKQFAEYCGTPKFVCLNSATAAMEMTLRLFGIKKGDEVITSAYTYTASAAVICHVGATPVIVDTEPGSFQISPEAIANAVTNRTKAVITVDIAGVICDYDSIRDVLAQKSSMFMPNNDMQASLGRVLILADAAHSFGSIRNGLQSGLHADFTCFSFHAIKNLAMGEGGGITWRPINGFADDGIYNDLMLLSLHGQTKDALSKIQLGSWEYDIKMPGYKCNLTDIMASLGIAQLKRYGDFLEKRKHIAEMYNKIFSSQDNLETLKHTGENFESNRHLYIVRILNAGEEYRNSVIKKMAERKIPVNVHFKPLPLFTAYKEMGYNIKDFTNAYEMYKNAISLPIHTLLTDSQVTYIGNSFKEILVTYATKT